MSIDKDLDMRLARLTPGREADTSPLGCEALVRLLDVLDVISSGGRLVLLLNHLTRQADPKIASKAAVLIGRRLHNQDWVTRQLSSVDDRVRANTTEGLWEVRTPGARSALWRSLTDKNNRVVGNALIGLHKAGEPGVEEFVRRMIEDPRPAFRWTAAWVMGKIGSPDFVEVLGQALHDKEANVRTAAERSLETILQAPAPAAAPDRAEMPPHGASEPHIHFDGQFVRRLPRHS